MKEFSKKQSGNNTSVFSMSMAKYLDN